MGLLDDTTQQKYYDGSDHGNYQFTSLDDVISQFIVAYVGEDKIISKIKRTDVAFHAQRAMQELSFDTFKSTKAQEITVSASLQMTLPQDYVNYTKISWVDSAGIKHLLYPTSKTSNPSENPLQNSDGLFKLQAVGTLDETSQIVVLDKEYKNILVGMTVSGPNIPIGTVVGSTSNLNSITTISLVNVYFSSPVIAMDVIDSPAVLPTYTGTETLTFTMFPEPYTSNDGTTVINENLIVQEASAVILEGNTWALGVFTPVEPGKITASSISEAAKVSVGMHVSHAFFSPGAKVIDVNGAVITTDLGGHADSTNTTHSATNEITFFLTPGDTTAWANYKSSSNNQIDHHHHHDDNHHHSLNSRYGLDPQHAQANGSFYIDDISGKIHFSSNISGQTVILDYISDSLGTDGEMQVHKFAEEAIYKCIAYAILATRANTQEYLVQRFKKERFAAIRTAKLRLSNIKLEEITQILRGKSKQIKH